ncbi:hypothetical protein LPB140_10440 [Sphingorhabdus lutea]|uniref:Uncharacterized protein n=1 Tax=Sphingorhabdus lutea TaxID=1913578 RepID=A0A1L3JDD6_9SPHN|nr:hypothetical protein [Sphingorhabdus lutea]APG63135.1 hypothetical protein LPB140_10440 [Sphingorhabdus lutea]
MITNILIQALAGLALLTLIGCFFGPAHSRYQRLAKGTLSARLNKQLSSWSVESFQNEIESIWNAALDRIKVSWVAMLGCYPASYNIRSELLSMKKWVLDSARIWAAAVRVLNSKIRTNPDIRKIEKAKVGVEKAIADLSKFGVSLTAPETFAEEKKTKRAAFIARVFFVFAIPFNFAFAVAALTDGNFLNSTLYHYGLAAIAVAGFEVGGGAFLYSAKNLFTKFLAILIVLAGCLAEAFFAIRSGLVTSLFENAGIVVFERVSDDPYAQAVPTLMGIISTGTFGFILGILIALITHNYFQKTDAAKDVSSRKAMARRWRDGERFTAHLASNLDHIKDAATSVSLSLDDAHSKLNTTLQQSVDIAKRLESNRADFLRGVNKIASRDWNDVLESHASVNDGRMRAAPVIPIIAGVMLFAAYLLCKMLLSGLETDNQTLLRSLALAMAVSPFALGATIFRPIVNPIASINGKSPQSYDLSKLGKPTLFLMTLAIFVIALNRPDGFLSGFTGSVALTAALFIQVWVFMLCGSHAQYVIECVNFVAASIGTFLLFSAKAVFTGLRYLIRWLFALGVILFEAIFFLLALPWKFWVNLIQDIRGLRS